MLYIISYYIRPESGRSDSDLCSDQTEAAEPRLLLPSVGNTHSGPVSGLWAEAFSTRPETLSPEMELWLCGAADWIVGGRRTYVYCKRRLFLSAKYKSRCETKALELEPPETRVCGWNGFTLLVIGGFACKVDFYRLHVNNKGRSVQWERKVMKPKQHFCGHVDDIKSSRITQIFSFVIVWYFQKFVFQTLAAKRKEFYFFSEHKVKPIKGINPASTLASGAERGPIKWGLCCSVRTDLSTLTHWQSSHCFWLELVKWRRKMNDEDHSNDTLWVSFGVKKYDIRCFLFYWLILAFCLQFIIFFSWTSCCFNIITFYFTLYLWSCFQLLTTFSFF